MPIPGSTLLLLSVLLMTSVRKTRDLIFGAKIPQDILWVTRRPKPCYGVNKENYLWSLISLSYIKSWCQFDIVMTSTWCLIYRHMTHDCAWADNGIVQCQVQGISSQMALADSRTTGLDNVSISHASGTMRTHQSRGLKIYKSESRFRFHFVW